ncbi:Rab3 GTPase-activating protein catalytic subunit-domain-containing protein [Gilbertella persicaria]|uniref:Rab3 GTPase-activating protein catalytic subunit-domain-containing protein n=1 Tax=Gilbertella persicaria TaxID=101096 RepID=UPI002221158D|nr:Rab3 GTPase-activating protein catalytic subunit-domain-containing protein [Gilbertella persicaria]KAI8051401.1 Rab3 GTPase-activating protein catalytic subunit-domain-containing protein [Gilbertella persicaria]
MTLTTPPTSPLNSLDGLKALFLQKLSVFRENEVGQPGDTDNVWLSAIYTYNLKNWFDERWKEWEPVEKRRISFSDDFDDWDQQEDTKTPMPLPFGSLNDPLRTLTLAAIFPSRHLSEFCWSPMDGLTASQWQIAREFAPASQQRAYLSRLLQNAVHSWIQDPANREYLAPYDEANEDASSDRVMRSLFGPNSSTDPITLIKSDQVETVLTRLFEPTQQEEPHERVRWKLHHGSTVPYRSFLWNMILYSLQTVAQQDAQQGRQQTNFIGFLRVVWLEVLKQIRWHWDHREPLPDLNPYLYNDNDKTLGIDLRYNMLHQKLAMVNCCIVRQSQEPMASEPMSDASSEEDSDVFVDAMDDEESSFVSLPCADQEAIQDPEKAEGQLEPHPTLTLLQTGQVMQIPITQDPGFMTEDMVTEQADVLRSLGTSDDATQKRARLQSAQLLSDMQAFKAANPYACLEDFVRWYSPRDWVDGQLSTRMSEPNNIWQELWQSSKRIPCSRQKPLFDMKKEVEKALFYLETLSVHDMFAM